MIARHLSQRPHSALTILKKESEASALGISGILLGLDADLAWLCCSICAASSSRADRAKGGRTEASLPDSNLDSNLGAVPQRRADKTEGELVSQSNPWAFSRHVSAGPQT